MNNLNLQLWCDVAEEYYGGRQRGVIMKNDLQDKLKEYVKLKEYIQKYNEEELAKGLDLGVRILQDLMAKYPKKLGKVSIEFENEYSKEELILKIGAPFNPNGGFFNENKGARDYVIERYPDAKKHYLGIEVAKLISKRNIDDFLKEHED